MNNNYNLPQCSFCGGEIEQEDGHYLHDLLCCSSCYFERIENEDFPLRVKWSPRGKWGDEDGYKEDK